MTLLVPKNWKEFQHYKDRSPPWIRLHKCLLDDYEFQCLPVASRALAPMLWLLASDSKPELGGAIEFNIKKLAFRLRQSEQEIEEAINPLISSGFFCLEDRAIDVLADCLHGAVPEAEAEADKSANADSPGTVVPIQTSACPHQKIIDLYHEVLPMGTQVRVWNEARAKHLQARWREKPKRQNIDWWGKFFAFVAKSKFLTGQASPTPGRDPFVVSLDWLVSPQNFAKVIEGRYHNDKDERGEEA